MWDKSNAHKGFSHFNLPWIHATQDGLQNSSNSPAWALIRKADSLPHPRPAESKSLGVGSDICILPKSSSDSDAPQHLIITFIEHPHKPINYENPETINQSTSLEVVLTGPRESLWLCIPKSLTLTCQGHTQPENRPWKV